MFQLFKPSHFRIETELTVQEVTSLLEKNTMPFSFSTNGISMGGSIRDNKIILYRLYPMARNSFKPVMDGKLYSTEQGTIFRGVFRLHFFTKVFWCVWFGAATLISGLVLFTEQIDKSLISHLLFVFLGGISLVKFGSWFSRHDPSWLIKKVEDVLARGS